jgi:hypothetical protein
MSSLAAVLSAKVDELKDMQELYGEYSNGMMNMRTAYRFPAASLRV